MTLYITCDTHGRTPAHAACIHINAGFRAGKPSGFHHVYDEDDCVSALCSICDDRLDREFEGNMENVPRGEIEFAMYCSFCIKDMASFNSVELFV